MLSGPHSESHCSRQRAKSQARRGTRTPRSSNQELSTELRAHAGSPEASKPTSHRSDPRPQNDDNWRAGPSRWEALTAPLWQRLQEQLATLSTDSKHIVVEQAGHNIQVDRPQVVVQSILDVVARVRAQAERRH